MAKGKTVPYLTCICGKRGWVDARDAEKALGRAQWKRNRQAGKAGSARGLTIESRYYECHRSHLLHLTSQSKQDNYARRGLVLAEDPAPTLTWEAFLAGQKAAAA